MFHRVIDFKKLRFNIDDLTPNGNNKILFGNMFKSDGFSVDLLFYRRERKKMNLTKKLSLIISRFPLILDANHFSQLFTVYSKKLESRKQRSGILPIETNMAASKIASPDSYHEHINYMLTHLNKLLMFAAEIMLVVISNYIKAKGPRNVYVTDFLFKLKWKPLPFREEKEKCPLVIFGDGVFGKDMAKLKNLRCGVVGKLYLTLKKREAAGELIVLTIDEFKTSKTCSSCFDNNLGIVKTPYFKGNSVLACPKCKKVWQRDVNAAINMMTISRAVWMGEERPEVFRHLN
ncbi:hypothetical protein [Parasitella parasitica]|uniref:Cas12f1-like TNB domain-containing protein n=1 Tax=Parasitella parasitica TaxID=35722 RepID=A0A0B7NH21_9FUNG|nr:hypothetical protein [Parasitella parasitica]